ncbi:hypothetical protein P6P90_08360 [Ectobacillus antri]|jgi:hypothetical protein|uniref:Uncharacterized protein n=1 Tax=Ectobacillus antri TaxID=2486280 RepID=A0ABT6H6B8_9BACI|nr:hypothetical protein [Ectobacillus antri]MDG4656651.1 hypothetical protein [Ectobacillus antri]MDG5753986.1 hypothetical protein [Ectobacillus antri]
MITYMIDFIVVAILVIGLTATIGILTNGIGEAIGTKNKKKFVNKSASIQTNWKMVGGNGIYKKKTY